MFNVNDILKATRGSLKAGKKTTPLEGVSIDSRTTKRGEVFIALGGRRYDGHNFIEDAIVRRARCVVVSYLPPTRYRLAKDMGVAVIKVNDTLKALGDIAAYHRKRFAIPVVAITGSNGKTSVKELTAHMLGGRYDVLKNVGTENNLIGVPLTLLRLNKGHDVAVLEFGANHLGEIERLTEIAKPSIGLITNIGQSHLEFLGDRRGVLEAKSEMIKGLPKRAVVILNADDDMLSEIDVKQKRMTFGIKKMSDLHASRIKMDGRTEFILNEAYPMVINTLGRHNVYNALAAIAISSVLKVSMPEIRKRLANFTPVAMRMEHKTIDGIDIINDAYNSNPLSLKWAVKTFSDFKANGKKIMVSGDMLELGEKSRFYHDLAGRLIARSSVDMLITVGKRSRQTVKAAVRSGMKKRRLKPCSDTGEARAVLKGLLKKGDAVLIKGSRGMALEKIIENL